MENNNSNTDEIMQNRTSTAQNDLQDGMAGSSQSTQNVTGAGMTLESLEAQEQNVQASQKKLRKKSVMLLVATMLVIAVLVALAIAWYTRVANTYAVTFDVADYDLTMNENVDDEYLLNVYEYAGLTGKTTSVKTGTTTDANGNTTVTTGEQHTMMAPGTIGWIPLKISAYHSDVDVTYYISLESKMPEKLYKHMRFFVLAEKTTGGTGTVTNSKATASQDGKTYIFHYGDAVPYVNGTGNTDAINNTSKYTKIYLDSAYVTEKGTNKRVPDDSATGSTIISDNIKLGGNGNTDTSSKTLCIYWEWYWDEEAAVADSKPGLTEADKNATAWDKLDTDIGRYPDKYVDAFTMYIKTTGTQVTPTNGQRTSSK